MQTQYQYCDYHSQCCIIPFTAESICNAGGLGFSGYDNEGKAVWDNAKNIDFKNFEFGVNPRVMTMAWNIKTVYWVRRCV